MSQANNVAIESSQINSSGVLQVAGGGTGVTTSTGSGNLVLSTSPTLVTPVLGTPTSVTLTNATGLPLSTGVTGTLPIANGGTGGTTYTANNVLLGNGTSAFQVVAPGTTGNILTSNGTTWTSSAPAGGGFTGSSLYGFTGTASRATTVMTVSAVSSGTIRVGDVITSYTGTSFGTVSSFGTGTGGAGTYNMSASGTIASTSIYTSSATFTIPTGKTTLRATIIGGGGGSGVFATNNGGAGGTTSIASGTQTITTISATGGGGTGNAVGYNGITTGANGSTSNVSIGITGYYGPFLNGGGITGYQCANYFQGNNAGIFTIIPVYGTGAGNGGGVVYSPASGVNGGAGGQGYTYLTGLTPGNTLTLTIGAPGAANGGTPGGTGVVLFEY
jgi:hypothetical protein